MKKPISRYPCTSQFSAGNAYISTKSGQGFFPLVAHSESAPLCVCSQDHPGVLKVVKHLQTDIKHVTGIRPQIVIDEPVGNTIVIIGTIGKNPVIDKLIQQKKINAEEVAGRWDSFALQIVENPLPNVDQAVAIFGSNKRGTIYGMYDLSSQVGVSPWYWWADVPIQKEHELYVKPGLYSPGEPKVKYRGIFLNDEAPALSNWAKEKFGGFNHKFYEKVFELILRNKGNFLWPAMWPPTAFFDDDPENPRLADEFGVIVSTSHHEPMMRSHEEWYRYGEGEWNYETNEEKLQELWRGGIERMGNRESVVTVGMRGDGDAAMSESTAINLLKTIIADQRKIIADVTGKPAEETPQVWAIYKEVQDYYDKGMRVDDDILLLFCDDNWGNIRILPKKDDLQHKGGYGIYYHFDFVGGPTSYKWLNVTQIERVWEQMDLAYQWGARQLWIVNVGDLKPMELPMSFFLDFAWNPDAITSDDLPNYYTQWAAQQFGHEHASEIGEILSLYTKYNARRTPEMLEPFTYSLANYREADRIVEEYQQLAERAQEIYDILPEHFKAAYYQLVLFPVLACSNINKMMVAAGKNQLYTTQGRMSANTYAEKVEELFSKDAEMTRYFHQDLQNGKWNHMMSQTHLGYTYWNNPPVNKMPSVSWVQPRATPELGYVIENGRGPRFEGDGGGRYDTKMPLFDPINDQSYYIELFNIGTEKIEYTIIAHEPWVKLSSTEGSIQLDEKAFVNIDWSKVPQGQTTGHIVISGLGKQHRIEVPIRMNVPKCKGFIENDGVISIEASHFNRAVNKGDDVRWITVPNLGRTGDSVTVAPANADRRVPGKNAPHLEYTFTVFNAGEVEIETYISPTLNYQRNEGLKYAISVNDEKPQTINIHEGETTPDWEYPEWWNNSVTAHIKKKHSTHRVAKPGIHTLKIWMIDPGVVFQKFVIDAGGLKPSYLGPPESVYLESTSGE
jgi:hypothetical protein